MSDTRKQARELVQLFEDLIEGQEDAEIMRLFKDGVAGHIDENLLAGVNRYTLEDSIMKVLKPREDSHLYVCVKALPTCDICTDHKNALYDARVPFLGCWANICQEHFDKEHCSLGLGQGQAYVVRFDALEQKYKQKYWFLGNGELYEGALPQEFEEVKNHEEN